MRLAALVTIAALALPFRLLAEGSATHHTRGTSGASGMARIPAGTYRPLYAARGEERVTVHAFSLDRHAVTRGEFLAFVESHPEWRRGAVPSTLAQPEYLHDWPSATNAGSVAALHQPVVNVSWFAANAFCAAEGKRLPTVGEWERAAAASETLRDASDDAAFRRRLLALYASRVPAGSEPMRAGFTNVFGVSGLHGVVWEWTQDAGGAPMKDMHDMHAGHDDRDHLFCANAASGASDPGDYPAFLRYAVRAALTARSTTSGVGFRCAA